MLNPQPSAGSGGGGAEASQPPRIILQGSLEMPASAGTAGNTRVDSDYANPNGGTITWGRCGVELSFWVPIRDQLAASCRR